MGDGVTVWNVGDGVTVWNVGDGVTVWNDNAVQCTITTTWAPVSRSLFWYHVQWARPGTRRDADDAKLQHVLKFLFSHLKTLGCQAPGPGRNRSTGGFYVVSDVMLHRTIWRAYLCKCQKLRQEREVRVVWVFGEHRWAGRVICNGDTLYLEVGDCIRQLMFPHVYEESKVTKKVSTKDGFLHVGNKENPREGTTKT